MVRMDRAANLSAASGTELAQPRGSGAAAAAHPARADLAEAVRQAQDGDEDAFRVLYRDLQPRFLRYLRVIVGDDAEDVASETWLHIARGLKEFHGDSDGFRGWTATIARNRATDHLRQHQRRPRMVSVPVEDLAPLAGREDTADSALEGISTAA